MIEVCKVDTPDGAVWFSLDSHQDGRQLVGIPDSEAAKGFAQAFPASLYTNDLKVTEHKLEDRTHFDVSYRRADRKLIQFSIETEDEDQPPRKRNGNAMNHSADQSLAVLDIFSLDLHSKTLEWPHQEQPVFSVLGKPVVARMRQSVGNSQRSVGASRICAALAHRRYPTGDHSHIRWADGANPQFPRSISLHQ